MENINWQDLLSGNNTQRTESVFSDSIYVATVIGYSTKLTSFDGAAPSPKTKLIMQLLDDNGKVCHITSQPLSLSMHEKSGLRKMLTQYWKTTDQATLTERLSMDNVAIVRNGKFAWSNFIGWRTKLMISLQAGRDGKSYPNIMSYLPPGTDKHAVDKTVKVPAFFFEDSIDYQIMDGLSIWSKDQQTSGTGDDFIDSLTP